MESISSCPDSKWRSINCRSLATLRPQRSNLRRRGKSRQPITRGSLSMLKIIGTVLLAIFVLRGGTFAQNQPPLTQSAEQLHQELSPPSIEPSPTSSATPTTADELERALQQREEAQQQMADPARPRTHHYTSQPVGRIL